MSYSDATAELLLNDLARFVRRFVAMTEAQAVAVALWCAHTHTFEAFEATPYLVVTSAEKRSGKSRLFDVLELLVARPWRAVTPSEAVTFRRIERDCPTLLLDEVDAIFGPKANGNTEGLRALLNAGNRIGTKVPRCVGQSQQLVEFSIFCAKALAGIGKVPDTVADRAVLIRLKRKTPQERVERFRRRDVDEDAEPLHISLAAWADPHIGWLAEARPAIPDALHDRAADAWEPLLAIADLAGGEWPRLAREAALELAGADLDADDSLGIRLLADVRAIFDEQGLDKLSSASLAAALAEIEESPWGEWHGNPIGARGVAKLLKRYEVRPRSVRLGDGTTPKGYTREDFEELWDRYTPENGFLSATPPQPAWLSQKQAESIRHTTPAVADTKEPANPHGSIDVAVWRIESENLGDPEQAASA